jgi:hypothetical protein
MSEPKRVIVMTCNPPIPTNICWEAWVDGEEERYGAAYGTTREEAIQNIKEAIEMLDDEEAVVEIMVPKRPE